MASNRRTSESARALPGEAAVDEEKDCTCPDKRSPSDVVAPRAGRTGGLGTRAERPSEGSERKGPEKQQSDARPKPPSPNAERSGK